MDRYFKSPIIRNCNIIEYDDRPTKNLNDRYTPLIVTQSYREIKTKSLADDFYSNLIDWHNDKVYFAIDNTVYIHDFYTSKTSLLNTIPDNIITSVKGMDSKILLGTSSGNLHTIDLIKDRYTKNLVHKSRIGVIKVDNNIILTGSRDKRIKLIDSRCYKTNIVILQHTQEVCGLDLSKNNKTLVTGGNDNKMYIFDYRNLETPLKKCNQHKAAIKAISWSPVSTNLFVTGGGSADKTVKLWDMSLLNNTTSVPLVKSINYGSQVCNLKWLSNNQILSTHGYSKDDIRMCGSYNFNCTRQFLGHKNRVIHFSVSKDEKYFVTGSSDCSIKFWEINGEARKELEISTTELYKKEQVQELQSVDQNYSFSILESRLRNELMDYNELVKFLNCTFGENYLFKHAFFEKKVKLLSCMRKNSMYLKDSVYIYNSKIQVCYNTILKYVTSQYKEFICVSPEYKLLEIQSLNELYFSFMRQNLEYLEEFNKFYDSLHVTDMINDESRKLKIKTLKDTIIDIFHDIIFLTPFYLNLKSSYVNYYASLIFLDHQLKIFPNKMQKLKSLKEFPLVKSKEELLGLSFGFYRDILTYADRLYKKMHFNWLCFAWGLVNRIKATRFISEQGKMNIKKIIEGMPVIYFDSTILHDLRDLDEDKWVKIRKMAHFRV